MRLEYSVCAYWSGRYKECQTASLSLLKQTLDDDIKNIVEQNLGFANVKLLEKVIEEKEEKNEVEACA